MLQTVGPFAVAFPTISGNFLKNHERRNKLPGAHPYDQKGGTQNTWLTRQERDNLIFETFSALEDLSNFILNHP